MSTMGHHSLAVPKFGSLFCRTRNFATNFRKKFFYIPEERQGFCFAENITRGLRSKNRCLEVEDIEKKEKNERIEAEAMQFCKERITDNRLPMNLIAVELSFDGSKLVFFYISKVRVDFRELVKDLVQRYNTQVEMRQIGTRDLARMQGGLGHCGRQLCCSLFLSNFEPISIRMAKEQDLSLNPGKISGICGRLMCCLAFEDESKGRMYTDEEKVDED